MAVKVSVVIATHGQSKNLGDALVSLQKQSFFSKEYEIIVVENGSRGNAKQFVENINKKYDNRVRYIYEPHPGLHRGRNTGAKEAKGDIVLYTDDDAIVSFHWIEEIYKCYDDLDVGVVGGKVVGRWEIEPPEWVWMFGTKKNIVVLSTLDLGEGIFELQKRYVFGVNYSARKSVIFEAGGSNPDLFPPNLKHLGGDGEVGFLNKVRAKGYKIVYNSNAMVEHYIPAGRCTFKYFIVQFQKVAIESVYRIYRNSNGSIIALIKALIRQILSLVKYYGKALLLQPNQLLIHRIRLAYYISFVKHSVHLVFSKSLKQHTLQKNYMD